VNSRGLERLRPLLELSLGLSAWLAAAALLAPPSPAAPAEQATPAAAPLPQTPALTASYTLRARLDEKQHRVFGGGTIRFVNDSRVPLERLFFHLYLNAFKNDRTLFLRSPFSAGRSGQGAREYGYIDVKRLTAADYPGVDLWKGRALHSPGDPEDETDIEVPLPSPLAPGAVLSLEVEFESKLPQIIERTGYAGSFHCLGQWFPKLARLEANGEFAHFAFHGQAEFYADFGSYDVTLDVPANYLVGASGRRVTEQRRGDRHELRFVAEPVHDFAWVAWDGFREQRTRVAGVDVSLLAPPDQEANVAASVAILKTALPEFSRSFGAYPYPTLTVVHPPDAAAAAGGMEYPTLITTGGPWYLAHTGARSIEAVTAHELAHQWFYGLVASNEARFPFLDEGLSTFAELKALRSRFGNASLFGAFDLQVSAEALFRALSALRPGDEPIASAASDFTSFENLGLLVYLRTATVLETLGRVFGRAELDRALAAYAQKYRFRHPGPRELLEELRSHLGETAAAVFERAVFERGRVNYVVREIRSARQQVPAGFFERASGRVREHRQQGLRARHQAKVTVYRQGELVLPVEVLLIAADGSRRLERWDGTGSSHSFLHDAELPLVRVVVDPEHRILLDDDLFDNYATTAPVPLFRSHERLAYFGALALGGLTP
jgi:hypothetical protein